MKERERVGVGERMGERESRKSWSGRESGGERVG